MRLTGRWFKAGAAALIAASIAVPAVAAVSPAERKMAAAVNAEQERTLGFLKQMVDQNSGSQNMAGVEAVGRMVRAELEPLGFAGSRFGKPAGPGT